MNAIARTVLMKLSLFPIQNLTVSTHDNMGYNDGENANRRQYHDKESETGNSGR
jgi:hypothetical protein